MIIKEYSRRQGKSKEKEERSQGSRSSGQKCKFCYRNEEGHIKTDYPKQNKNLMDEKPSIVGVAQGLNLFDGGGIFLATAKNSEKSNWILDCSCPFHMYLVRERFDIYQPCEKGTINMANSAQSRWPGWE